MLLFNDTLHKVFFGGAVFLYNVKCFSKLFSLLIGLSAPSLTISEKSILKKADMFF